MKKVGQLDIQLIGGTDVLFTRHFKASPQFLFEAHTKPDLVKRWLLGPPGWDFSVCEIDLRVGGKWRFVRTNPEHGSFEMGGEFLEIDTPRKLSNSEISEDASSVQVITFDEQGGGTLMSQRNTFASFEAREAALATGMADGMEACYVYLEAMLAEAG